MSTGIMNDLVCCERCHHSAETPCQDIITCLNEGPRCHSDSDCLQKTKARLAQWRRESLQRPLIAVGAGTCGLGAGAGKVLNALREYAEITSLDVEVLETGCIGLCSAEPLMEIQLPGRNALLFQQVQPEDVPAILSAVLKGQPESPKLLGQQRQEGQLHWGEAPFIDQHPFFKSQTRWVLANCGRIVPTSIREYVARGGYQAAVKTLRTMTREEVCDLVEKSGLRGRGGGGFPTGRKWKVALAAASETKYLICNADEGDPGAFMDRAVIEGDPHRLVEGIILAAYGIGARQAYVYIRAEYPLAIRNLKEAISQARSMGLLGKDIAGSGFELEITVKQGAGAFVCGEETALIHSIEGRRGMPRPRPPYPAVAGLFGQPTVINNVETLANLPLLLLNGADWFSAVGTGSSKGTKVFALSGKVERTGLVEVAMGTSVREIVFTIGGGIPDGKRYKAVQIGGPSGGCIPEQHLDIDVDYESLKQVGAMMGSGGLVVMDEDTCMVDVARFFMDFIQRESCGKCIPCREGTKRLLETLQSITSKSEPEPGALSRFHSVMYMERLANTIRDTSLCGLGQSAPNPVLSTLRFFRDEYEAHVYERRCPAGVCTDFLTYLIDAEKCNGCTACARKCPTEAIVGSAKSAHFIVPERCIRCGACLETCRFEAISVV